MALSDFFRKYQPLFEANDDKKEAEKSKADKDSENYSKGNVRANWGDKAEQGPGSANKKKAVKEGWSDENPDKDKSEWAEEQQCRADDKRKADKEDAACKALDKKAKKPANVKESGSEFFRRYADIITEAEADDEEDPDVKIADSVKGKDGTTQSDAEKKLPPWLQKKDAFDKKDKKAEDAGSKKVKKDKDI